jgi:hypothetical protein
VDVDGWLTTVSVTCISTRVVQSMEQRDGGNVLLQLPFTIIEGAYVPGFEPAGDAVEVEGVLLTDQRVVSGARGSRGTYVTDTPCGITFFGGR